MSMRERSNNNKKKKRLEVVNEIHDPLPLSLFELFALSISDALDVL